MLAMSVLDTHPADAFANDRKHVFHSWSAQAALNPAVITRAQGSEFWTEDGTRYLDFSSQLVNAIKDYADKLCTVAPFHANDARSEAARLIVEVAGTNLPNSDLNMVFFTNGGAEDTENAVRMTHHHTDRNKGRNHYRAHHAATNGAITLTGDPRRWPSEPGMPGVVKFWGPYAYRSAFHSESEEQESERALRHLDDVLMVEGAHTVAAIILETVVGTNGILVPPPGYLEGIRDRCDRHGIVMICDEVMAGFGRCGEWFAFQKWGVQPDLVCFAKGVNSGYLPLGGVVISDKVSASFRDKAFPGGLTYSGHPLACASAVASINIFKDEGIIEHARSLGADVIAPGLEKLQANHPSVGEVRGLGVFWALDLVKDRATREPLAPYNAAGADAKPMLDLAAACKAKGLWPFTHFNRLHVCPPCTTSVDQIEEGLAILDEALTVADQFYTG